jgi:hypothetical protein
MKAQADHAVPTALRAIVARDFLLSDKYDQQHARATRQGADEGILAFERKFIRKMEALGVPMFAHSVIRSPAEQTKRFAEGHSKAKAGQSPHQYGMAVDLIHGIRGWDIPDESWALVGHIGKEVASTLTVSRWNEAEGRFVETRVHLEWGGDWKSLWDPAHWQIKGWRDFVPPF